MTQLLADVFDCLILDSANNVVATTTLQDANINITTNSSEVRAGIGHNLLAIIHSSKDIEVNLTDIEFKLDYLAMSLGTSIVTESGLAYHMPTYKTVVAAGSDKKIVLEEAPKMVASEAMLLKIFKQDGTAVTVASISTKDVLLTGVDAGDIVEVRTYIYETSATTKNLSIDSKIWPKDYKLALETLIVDASEQPIYKIQYIFDRSKPSGNITLNTSSNREATAQEISFMILKPKTSTQIGRVLKIPIPAPST